MDAGESPQVVVECVLSDEPVQTLYLSYTKGASRDVAPELPEATVVLTDLTEGKEAGRFARAADETWTLDYAAIPYHTYRLEVTIPGNDLIWAEQMMPEAPNLDVHWDWWRENLPEGAKYRDTHGYVFSTDTLRSPVWFYGINQADSPAAGKMTERLCTDYPEVDVFSKQESIYWLNDEYSRWGCWFRTSAYPDLEGRPYFRNYLRFPVRAGEKTEFLVAGDFRNYLADPADFIRSQKYISELHWFSASEDYDHYLTDSWSFRQKGDSMDLSSIFLRDNIYSNIQGATGIFGAKVERSVRWDDDWYWGRGGMFILPGFEKDSYPKDGGYKNSSFHAANYQKRPFTLLLYEVRDEHPEEWTYGEKLGPNASLFRIENDEQMREHGIEGYGPVDFTNKDVWLMYAAFPSYHLPVLTAHFVDNHVIEDYGPVFGEFCVIEYLLEETSSVHYTSSRIAIVVDKTVEELYRRVSYQFFWYYLKTAAKQSIDAIHQAYVK